MYKELLFSLTAPSSDPLVLTHVPDGWADASMIMERQKKYYGVFRSFSVPMKWAKEGAKLLRGVFYTYGLASLVLVKIEKLDKYTLTYETVFQGKIDFTTFKDNDYFVEANVIDGSLAEIIKNREGDELDLTQDYWIATDANGTMQIAIGDMAVVMSKASPPLAVFQALVNAMTDGGACPASPTFAAKSDLLSSALFNDGVGTLIVLTNESQIKWTISSAPFCIKTSLADFFASINAITPIGLGIEIIGGKETLVLEEREYFFDQTSIITTLGEVKNFGLSLCQDLVFSKIKCGWPNKSYNATANKGQNEASVMECNTETTFAIPTKSSKIEYDILGKYRADSTYIETEAGSENQEDACTHDNDLFFIQIQLFIGTQFDYWNQSDDQVRKKNDHAIIAAKGMVRFSPRRCLRRHQTFISCCAMGLEGQLVTFLTGTNDQANNETAIHVTPPALPIWELEYAGFRINSSAGYFKPVLIDFEVPYPQTMISLINAAPTGILGFYYQENLYYGYLWKTETKLGGRGSVKFTLLSILNNNFSNLNR